MLPSGLILEEYVDAAGKSPFGGWFEGLEANAAAKVAVALARIERGALSNVKGVGEGCWSSGSISVRAIASISGATGIGW